MSALAEKLRSARTLRVEAGGYVFLVLRPTPLEREERLRGPNVARGILSFVTGWEGVTEMAMRSGGDPHPVPFDAAACEEWLSDRPDLFNAIARAVADGIEAYMRKLEDDLKN